MVAISRVRPSPVVARSPAVEHASMHEVLARLEMPPAGNDPAAERRREAERLVAVIGGDRDVLDRLRSAFLGRLHRASDDFGATEGLRVVEAALWLIPWPEGSSA